MVRWFASAAGAMTSDYSTVTSQVPLLRRCNRRRPLHTVPVNPAIVLGKNGHSPTSSQVRLGPT